MMLERKTKAELLEIIEKKESEILDLKGELRQLEKCQKYDDITDEIQAVYMKLEDRGFNDADSMELTLAMINNGLIPARETRRVTYSYPSYQNYR